MAEQQHTAQGSGAAGASRGAARVWTIRDMLSWCEGYLAKHGDPDPRGSARWLVEHATGLEKVELYLNMDRALEAAELDFLRDAVRRRAAGEPLQYLTGTAPFRFISVAVRPGVLIPRPETEVLVSALLELLPRAPRRIATDSHSEEEIARLLAAKAPAADADEASEDADTADRAALGQRAGESQAPVEPCRLQVLEVGTGSGCIACSIAFERPDADVTATDISPVAVALARENAQRVGVADRVSVIECDLDEGLVPESRGTFDALISNPPYIPTAVYDGLDPQVHDYEPQLALDGGTDGLDFFRRLLPAAHADLKPRGVLAVELHEDCLDVAAELARHAGFTDVRIIADLNGKPRVLTAHAPA